MVLSSCARCVPSSTVKVTKLNKLMGFLQLKIYIWLKYNMKELKYPKKIIAFHILVSWIICREKKRINN